MKGIKKVKAFKVGSGIFDFDLDLESFDVEDVKFKVKKLFVKKVVKKISDSSSLLDLEDEKKEFKSNILYNVVFLLFLTNKSKCGIKNGRK